MSSIYNAERTRQVSARLSSAGMRCLQLQPGRRTTFHQLRSGQGIAALLRGQQQVRAQGQHHIRPALPTVRPTMTHVARLYAVSPTTPSSVCLADKSQGRIPNSPSHAHQASYKGFHTCIPLICLKILTTAQQRSTDLLWKYAIPGHRSLRRHELLSRSLGGPRPGPSRH